MNCCSSPHYSSKINDDTIDNYKLRKQIPNKECLICLEEFKKNQNISVIINCGHYYHLKCLSEWFKRKEVCPICNINLK